MHRPTNAGRAQGDPAPVPNHNNNNAGVRCYGHEDNAEPGRRLRQLSAIDLVHNPLRRVNTAPSQLSAERFPACYDLPKYD